MFSPRGRKRLQPKSLVHNPQSNVFAHVPSLIPNQINTSRVVSSNQNRPTTEVALLAQYMELWLQYKTNRDHFISLHVFRIAYCKTTW